MTANSANQSGIVAEAGSEGKLASYSPYILYVEDDIVQASLVKPLLAGEGFSVLHVDDGYEALMLLRQRHVDIVLTDHYMPKMNGLELLHAVTANRIQVPIVIMTAGNDVSLAFAALRAGAADFITKDVDGNYLSLISTVLTRTLEKHTLQQRAKQLETELAKERELSHVTLDALSQGVITLDKKLNVRYGNACFKQLIHCLPLDGADACSIKELAQAIAKHGKVNNSADPVQIELAIARLTNNPELTAELTTLTATLELRASPLQDVGYAIAFMDISARKAQQQAMNSIISQAPVAIMAIDIDGQILLANRKAADLLNLAHEQMIGANINQFVPESIRDRHSQLIASYFDSIEPRRMRGGLDVELFDSDGKSVPVEVSLSGVEIMGKQRVLATIVNISHRKEAEEVMRRAHKLTQSIIDHSPFSIVATDTEGTIVAVSPALEKMLYYRKEDLIGKQSVTLFHNSEQLDFSASKLAHDLEIAEQGHFLSLTEKARRGTVEGNEWIYVRSDGTELPVNLTVTTLLSDAETVTGYLFVSYDITEQKRAVEYIAHIAHHDSLTGLPNRTLMQDRLQQALLLDKRNDKRTGILAIDLDHFKRVNDSLGHQAGDELLKTVAERLSLAVRESDTVCRMGGDEFVVILTEVGSEMMVRKVAEKIIKQLSVPIKIGLNSIIVTPSVGISIAPEDGSTVEELLKHADIAMYQVKQSGRNSFQAFNSEIAAAKRESIELEQELHEAFANGGLTLYYQPQVNINTGKVVGMEALIRWPHPLRGMISPVKFIPMAENTGIILKLGEWILQKACNEISALRREHSADYRVAVNVSPRQFDDPNFIRAVDLAIKQSGLPPNRLELEITEGLLVTESNLVRNKLGILHRMGITIAIDDFGTGYSSLSYVAKYPIDIIKIDRAFMAVEKKENSAIVGAITAIAEGLGLEVLAEGVETAEQLHFIRQKGCKLIQGYYFAQPVAYTELTETINRITESCQIRLVNSDKQILQ